MFTERFLRDKKGASPTPDERNRLEAAVSEIRTLQPRGMPRPRCRAALAIMIEAVGTRAGASVLV